MRPGRAGGSATGVVGEAILRSTPSYSIAALWVNVLADQAEEATQVLAALWADPAAARSGEQGANDRRMNAQ